MSRLNHDYQTEEFSTTTWIANDVQRAKAVTVVGPSRPLDLGTTAGCMDNVGRNGDIDGTIDLLRSSSQRDLGDLPRTETVVERKSGLTNV